MSIPEALRDYAIQLGFPESETLGRIFAILYEGENAVKVVAALPGTAAEVAQKTGLPEKHAADVAAQLLMQGRIVVDFKRPNVFRRFPAMIELRDSSVLDPNAPQELFELWERLVLKESTPLVEGLKKRDVTAMVRVIPIERTVQAQNTVLDVDSARKIFSEASLITAVPCVCRTVARKNGRGQNCPAPETAVCMQTNLFAMGVLTRKLGEKLSKDEALKRIGEAEDAGLVHMVRNNVQKDMFMCNCCACCCTGLYFLQQLNFPGSIAPSRFRVKLDPNACSGCGICEERCQFHAITMNDAASINLNQCYGCGNCVITCPEEALALEEIRPREFIRVKAK
ncbi:MAG: hypothetical protein A2V67_00620 [Deltaproteobacteria bacterium RBG_13_61_14]|nr:MAG: hypothetical protein A2V67_00620 [Deltaproteobacteria bacterium RBG_13_61_14]